MNRLPATPLRAAEDKRARLQTRATVPATGTPARLERKSGGPELKHLGYDDLEFKFDEATGEFEGYCSKFDLLDRGGDIVKPGAFRKSLADWKKRKTMPPVLWQHDSYSPVGIWLELREDDVGLFGKGQLVLDVPKAAEARALLKAKVVTGLSIGYITRDSDIDRQTGARHLKQVDLWEVSLVTFPMLPEAQITGVKGDIDPRAMERALRDEGLSARDAKAAIAVFRKTSLRDAGPPGPGPRDEASAMLMTLRKAAEELRN